MPSSRLTALQQATSQKTQNVPTRICDESSKPSAICNTSIGCTVTTYVTAAITWTTSLALARTGQMSSTIPRIHTPAAVTSNAIVDSESEPANSTSKAYLRAIDTAKAAKIAIPPSAGTGTACCLRPSSGASSKPARLPAKRAARVNTALRPIVARNSPIIPLIDFRLN